MSCQCIWCNFVHRTWTKCCKLIIFPERPCRSSFWTASEKYHDVALHMQVHAAFAGFSGITSCICNNHYVYLPITQVITAPKRVNPNSRMLHRCLTSTGQPDFHWPTKSMKLLFCWYASTMITRMIVDNYVSLRWHLSMQELFDSLNTKDVPML